jgi:hypothetical protein
MYCRLPFEYSTPQAFGAAPVSLSPSNETTYLFPNWNFSRKSSVALLLQRSLHNFSALAPVTPFDGITYRQNSPKTRKSFIALLLPHVFAVSPLLRYSYKKMGGSPLPRWSFHSLSNLSPTRNSLNSSHLSRFRGGPPHISPLESYGCRKCGWGRGMYQNAFTWKGLSGPIKYRQSPQTYLISGAKPAALRIPTLPDTMILAGICGGFDLPPGTHGPHS